MSFTKILSDGNGGYNLFENWTTGNDSMMKIIPVLFLLPVIIFFALIFPVIFWVIAPLEPIKDNHQNTYIGLAMSLLFFLDFWFGGLLWTIFHTAEAEGALYFFGALHIVFVLINIIRLYMYNVGNGEVSIIIVFIALFVAMYFGYDILTSISEGMCASTPCFWTEEFYNEEMLELAR